MSIYVNSGDDDPQITVSDDDDDGETIIVNPTAAEHVVVVPDPGPAPDVVIVTDETEPESIVVTPEEDPEIDVEEGPGPRGLPGMSAYDVAVMEGYVGTEQEWLLSLQGPPGDPGAPGSAPQAYKHDQVSPATVWVVGHGLGYEPSVTVFDSAGTEWEGDIEHIDNHTLTISWPFAFGGTAFLS